MTQWLLEELECAICHKTSEHEQVDRIHLMGFKDLDTRPPEMLRSTLRVWVDECPHCGYCAQEMGEKHERAPDVIKRREYRATRNNPDLPRLVNRFLCWAMIQVATGDLRGGAWSTIHAAWACDDDGLQEQAKSMRVKAVVAYEQALEVGQATLQVGADQAVMVDLLRRASELERAKKVCVEALALEDLTPKITEILEYQWVLISQRDLGRYSVDQALRSPNLKDLA